MEVPVEGSGSGVEEDGLRNFSVGMVGRPKITRDCSFGLTGTVSSFV